MVDVVNLALKTINNVLTKYYDDIQSLQEETDQFRRILRTSRSVLNDVLLQLENRSSLLSPTSLGEAMRALTLAVNRGGEVVDKCTQERSLKRLVLTKSYRVMLVTAANKILETTLGMLCAAGVAIRGSIQEDVEGLMRQVGELQVMVQNQTDVILDQLFEHGKQLEALPQQIVQELVRQGYIAKPQDYRIQIQEIASEAQELKSNREKYQDGKARLDEYTLLVDEELARSVIQLSLNEATTTTAGAVARPPSPLNDKLQQFICPISLDIMKDPVVLYPSGHSFDKESLCGWLLTKPDRDPLTNIQYDKPLLYADNMILRSLLMEQFGDSAFVKYDDSEFHNQYAEKWKARQIDTYEKVYKKMRSKSLVKAENALEMALAKSDDPVCLGMAACIVDPGATVFLYLKKDASRAREFWQRAVGTGLEIWAQQGRVQPWAQLVEAHRQHFHVKNLSNAVGCYQKLADQGHAVAQCSLGYMYSSVQGVTQNYETAVYWYQKSANQGDADAQFNLGTFYEYGQGVKQNQATAVEWYRRSAEQGDADAQFSLGSMYDNGKGVKQNYETAVYWYRRSAEQGDADAQFSLGTMYEYGHGVTQNHATAVEWYGRSANQGDADAQFKLGCMCFGGDGVAQNHATAIEWYRRSAAQGNRDAQFQLGCMYENGHGASQNYATAFEWYRRSAAQGSRDAQFHLGCMYENGHGATQNYATAFEWYGRSAALGNRDAQFKLGCLYENVHGATQNYATAFEWYGRSAAQGNRDAQFHLGCMYEHGRGATQNYATAVEWYRRSAAQGNRDAQFKLSTMSNNGEGVEQYDIVVSSTSLNHARKAHDSLAGYYANNALEIDDDDL